MDRSILTNFESGIVFLLSHVNFLLNEPWPCGETTPRVRHCNENGGNWDLYSTLPLIIQHNNEKNTFFTIMREIYIYALNKVFG